MGESQGEGGREEWKNTSRHPAGFTSSTPNDKKREKNAAALYALFPSKSLYLKKKEKKRAECQQGVSTHFYHPPQNIKQNIPLAFMRQKNPKNSFCVKSPTILCFLDVARTPIHKKKPQNTYRQMRLMTLFLTPVPMETKARVVPIWAWLPVCGWI